MFDIIFSRFFSDYSNALTDRGVFVYIGDEYKPSSLILFDTLYWYTRKFKLKRNKPHFQKIVKPIRIFGKTKDIYYNHNINDIQDDNYIEAKEYTMFKIILKLFCPNLHNADPKKETAGKVGNPDINKKLIRACQKLRLDVCNDSIKRVLF